jgi:hypothetical protein
MAVDLTLKGTAITNRDATPRVLNNPGLGQGGVMHAARGYLASVTAALSITSIIRLVQIPSNAIVMDVLFQAGAQGAGKFDLGVYRTTGDGGAVVDVDLFGSAIDAASAIAMATYMNESTVMTMAKQSQPLWQAAGMSADPKSSLDVALTVVTTDVTTGTTAVAVTVYYVV